MASGILFTVHLGSAENILFPPPFPRPSHGLPLVTTKLRSVDTVPLSVAQGSHFSAMTKLHNFSIFPGVSQISRQFFFYFFAVTMVLGVSSDFPNQGLVPILHLGMVRLPRVTAQCHFPDCRQIRTHNLVVQSITLPTGYPGRLNLIYFSVTNTF